MPPSLYFLFLGWCFSPLFLAAGFVDFSAFDLSGALLNVLIILKLFYYYFFIFIFCACFGWVLQPIQKCNYMWIDYLVLTLESYTKSHWNSKFFGRSKWQFDFFLLWKSRKEAALSTPQLTSNNIPFQTIKWILHSLYVIVVMFSIQSYVA